MPYKENWESNTGVVVKYTGVVTNSEVIKVVKDAHADHRYDRLRYVIHDLLEVDAFDVDLHAIQEVFAASVGAGMTNPNRKIYVVSNNATVLDYLGQYLKDYSGALPIKAYTNMVDAYRARDADLSSSGTTLRMRA
jgi:hypothetical protein